MHYLSPITYYTINHHFLKEHFDEFTVFLPEEDIPYYRGVIVNKARVYYASYIEERTKRMIQQEGENLSTSSQQRGNRLTKSTDVGRFYSQLEDHDGNAFIRLYIFPAIIVSLSLIIPLIAWVFALL